VVSVLEVLNLELKADGPLVAEWMVSKEDEK
jgi:hypothetical protein